MNEKADKRVTLPKNRIPLWPICAAACLLGAITGTVVFSRAFSEEDVSAFLLSQRALPEDFAGAFMLYSMRELVYIALASALSLFALGWIILPGMLFYRFIGTGVGACCVCAAGEWYHVAYALLVLVLPALFAALSCTLVASGALETSFGILASLFGRNTRRNNKLIMLRTLPFCAAVSLFSAAFGALMRALLYGFIMT